MSTWSIDPHTLALVGPGRRDRFTEQQLGAQEWPPCPACGAPVDPQPIETTGLDEAEPTFALGAAHCPNGCDLRAAFAGRVHVRVLLNVGDQAHLVTPTRDYRDPLVMPAAVIAEQAGLPTGELPGRRFTALQEGDQLTDFRLLNDPRL